MFKFAAAAILLLLPPVIDTPSATPPSEYTKNRIVEVQFVNSPSMYPGCEPSPGFTTRGCYRFDLERMIMPNPCFYPKDYYARVLCHELGHANGWSHPKAGPEYNEYVKKHKLLPDPE
jgi:hypothetical protein